MSYTYISHPYSHPEPEIREARYRAATAYSAYKLQRGETIYAPIVHNHVIAITHEMPKTWDFWKFHDLHMLRFAARIEILFFPGWSNSVGVRDEQTTARKLNIPIDLITASELKALPREFSQHITPLFEG